MIECYDRRNDDAGQSLWKIQSLWKTEDAGSPGITLSPESESPLRHQWARIEQRPLAHCGNDGS